METWQELKVTVKREGEELVSNLLIELGAQGVAIEDSMDYVGNVDRFGEIFPEVEQQEEIVVTAYYPETVDVATVESDLQARLAELTDFMDLGEVKMGTTALAEEDWADNWKKYYEPARITHDLTIVPSWTDYEATAGEKIIKLDPGMAFGTGTHPTTKMSLFALEQVLRGGETVLDVGTGSGVLSIASSLLGAKEIFAYDLDDVAVRVAQENIELNPGMENIHVAAGDLLKGVEIEADVIVANISPPSPRAAGWAPPPLRTWRVRAASSTRPRWPRSSHRPSRACVESVRTPWRPDPASTRSCATCSPTEWLPPTWTCCRRTRWCATCCPSS